MCIRYFSDQFAHEFAFLAEPKSRISSFVFNRDSQYIFVLSRPVLMRQVQSIFLEIDNRKHVLSTKLSQKHQWFIHSNQITIPYFCDLNRSSVPKTNTHYSCAELFLQLIAFSLFIFAIQCEDNFFFDSAYEAFCVSIPF